MDIERLPAFLADPAPEPGLTLLIGGHVVDESGRRSRDARTIHVRDGRIEAISGPDDGVPDGARVVAVTGMTVLAGLIDAHVHVSMLEDAGRFPRTAKGAEPLRAGVLGHLVARSLRDLLRHGVTTIRDVGAHGDVLFEARQAARYGAFLAPRMLVSGRIVSATAPGGRFFPGMYREADGPDDIRRAVREQIRAGADFVKVMSTGARSVELENPLPSQVTPAEMDAFVDEAHRQMYRTAAHCEGIAGTELAIAAGIDTVEHGFHLHERPDLLERMAERGTVLVPTLDFLHHVAESDAWTAELEAQGVENLDHAQRTLDAARRAGLVIAAGSDGASADGLALEIGRLVEHGLSPAEAIAAATSGSALALGIEPAVGRLEAGFRADLVVVNGDPTDDVAVLRDPDRIGLVLRHGIVAGGTLVEPRLGM